MDEDRSIEGLILTLDLCEHYLPAALPPIHRARLRRIRRLLRELAGTAQRDTASNEPPPTKGDHDR